MHRFLCLLALNGAASLLGQDAAALFEKNCAVCHKPNNDTRAPLPEAMAGLTREKIVTSLETGTMRAQGMALTPAQRVAIAEFLSKVTAGQPEAGAGLCPAGSEPHADSSSWNGWGADDANTRFQTAKMAGIRADQVPNLKLKWAFAFPNASAAIAQPVVVGGRMYFGSANGTVYSADAKTGCVYWTFKAGDMVRTPISVGPIKGGRHALMFGDQKAFVYAVDSRDGSLIWKTQVDDHAYARLTGAAKVHGSRLYVPISSHEEVSSGSAKYPCCSFRGSVIALDVETGRKIWKTHTIPDPPTPTKKNKEGTQLQGPSGAAVWTSPTLDVKRNVLYIGTGNAYSDPDTKYSDAVIAMDLDSGSVKWVQQLTPRDGWNFACVSPLGAGNCPEAVGPDVDIGASPILRSLPGGRSILVVGQKSGIVHGLDPEEKGKILWQTRIGKGGAMGGIVWGMASDEERVYVPLSDLSEREKAGGLFALHLANGERAWVAPPVKLTCAGGRGCSAAQIAPATVIPGVVFAGALDGTLRAHDAKDGKVVWEFNTNQEFQTVNGVKGHGGSLNATGPVIVGGMMYVNSGYGILGGMPGNVLLAFGVDEPPAAGPRASRP